MFHQTARIVENVQLADRTFRIRVQSPDIAASARPGQFAMLRLPGSADPLLGRPFAFYDTALDERGLPFAVDIVYLVVGRMTGRMAELTAGEEIAIWGPLGNPFLNVGSPNRVVLVAGGIGQTPFLGYARELLGNRGYGGDLARQRTPRVSLYYGVRTASLAAGVDDFRSAGVEVHVASDDGSLGFHGFVTQLLETHASASPLVGCGPELMLKALIRLAKKWDVPCQVSLETPMACGIGVCFSCVTRVTTPEGECDFKRVCVDGPAFDAAGLAWE